MRALVRIWIGVAVAVSVSWVVYLGVYVYVGHLTRIMRLM